MDKKAVVIAGAGSTHTPGIIQSLLQKKNELPLRKLALYDIDEKRMHLVYDIMKQFIELAKVVRDSEISMYEKKLELITDYAKNVLFRPEKNLFATAWDEYNIASQVWMVLAHVMSDEENKSIMQTTIQELFPVKNIATPYMYHHIVEALFEAGLDEEAIHLMKSYWGKMISLGADTYWEAFDPDQPEYSPYGSPIVNSYCHAWSCTPVYLLKKYVENK